MSFNRDDNDKFEMKDSEIRLVDSKGDNSVDKASSDSNNGGREIMLPLLSRTETSESIVCSRINIENLVDPIMSESERIPIRCFFSNLKGCNPAVITVIDEENIIDVSIEDEKKGSCVLRITEYTDVKGYTCNIPEDFWLINSDSDDMHISAEVLSMIVTEPDDSELEEYDIKCKT